MKKIKNSLYKKFSDGKKRFAVLIDPDKSTDNLIKKIAIAAEKSAVDFIFYGGSLLTSNDYDRYISILKDQCDVPVILFPGNNLQISRKADGILLLSLISGRNPELLIGKHVIAAPYLRASDLEIIPTGYILVDSGKQTTVSYMSNTTPVPSDKASIAVCTALAGEMLGLKLIYLDAGSGAINPVPAKMIREVRENISIPLVVGGGIKNAARAVSISRSGADLVVVGNAIENDFSLVAKISDAIHNLNT